MRAAVANRKDFFAGCPGRGIKTCQHDLYINVYGIYAVHKHTPIHTHTHTHTLHIHPSIRNAYVCIFLCSHRNSFRVWCVCEIWFIGICRIFYNLAAIIHFVGFGHALTSSAALRYTQTVCHRARHRAALILMKICAPKMHQECPRSHSDWIKGIF